MIYLCIHTSILTYWIARIGFTRIGFKTRYVIVLQKYDKKLHGQVHKLIKYNNIGFTGTAISCQIHPVRAHLDVRYASSNFQF